MRRRQMIEDILARISYLELGISALKYYAVSGDVHDGLRVLDDLAQTILDLSEDLENSKSPE